ncbi:ABC transporter ATP-binding protein [Streptococcus oralis]|uniref:ABC transporter ATP-binding protein n=1 Tax=Streptococcus oralis TaxID=1303 RepID=UPI002001961D|nr:ABC transporter ATP-binding protein [Streptococcus oralis]
MSNYAIEIKNLVKKFDGFTLGPIDLSIPKGTIVGYIGQNGAGKSTTIKLLLGLLKIDSGEIKILGYDNPNSIELKDKLGVVFDELLVPEEMTLVDLEKFCSRVYSKWDREFFYQLKKKFNLSEKQTIKNYSRGMRMKLSMAVALSHNAEILILDEATSGLDPIVREEILDLLLDFMQEENHTILISSHILSDLESQLIEAKAKKETIEAEKLTGDNIYKVLIYFDKLYKVMNDVERRQLIEALISEVQIYEEKQANGQWLKSITFKLPIIDENLNISLDNDEQVEAVSLLVRAD